MEKLTTVGIDLAKDVIAVCRLDVHGAVIERRVLRREAFERWAAQLPPCHVAMEACGSAHHWGRWFAARGHTARHRVFRSEADIGAVRIRAVCALS